MLQPFVDNCRVSIRANFPRHEFFLDLFLFPPFCLFWNRFFAEDSRGCGAKIQCNFFQRPKPTTSSVAISSFAGILDLFRCPRSWDHPRGRMKTTLMLTVFKTIPYVDQWPNVMLALGAEIVLLYCNKLTARPRLPCCMRTNQILRTSISAAAIAASANHVKDNNRSHNNNQLTHTNVNKQLNNMTSCG